MTHLKGAAAFLTRMMFDGNVVKRGMRSSGMLPSVVVIVEIAAPLGYAAECDFWRCRKVVSVAEFAGWCFSNLFILLLDSVEFVTQRSNFVKALANCFGFDFRYCGFCI